MSETWSPVSGYEDYYEVSNAGRVRGIARLVPHNMRPHQSIRARILTPRSKASGHLVVTLRRGKTGHATAMVHRLVALAFLPNPQALPVVQHLDHNPANNRVENLQWCTQADNLAHMTAAGRRSRHWLGKRSPNASLPDETVLAIRSAQGSWADIARRFGVSKTVVGRIIQRKTYSDV